MYKLALGKYEARNYSDNTQSYVYYAKDGIAYVIRNKSLYLVSFREEQLKPRFFLRPQQLESDTPWSPARSNKAPSPY